MNILSAVAFIDTKKINFITKSIEKIKECEIITIKNEKMIILISGNDEIKKFKDIKKIDGVLSLNLAYSYQENTKNQAINLDMNENIIQNSKYFGDINSQI